MWKKEFIKKMFAINIEDTDICGAIDLKYKNIPKSLFRYRTFDEKGHNLDNLASDSVWLSSPMDFNDPYDSALTLNLQNRFFDNTKKNFIETLKKNKSVSQKEMNIINNPDYTQDDLFRFVVNNSPEIPHDKKEEASKILKSVIQKQLDKLIADCDSSFKSLMYIACFSEVKDSILMWSHYAANHEGFCIEYDFKRLGNSDVRTRMLYPVIYNNNLFDATEYLMPSSQKEKTNILFNQYAAINKSQEWSYEKEWRLIIGSGVLKNATSYNSPKANAIYLGARASEENIKKVKLIAQSKNIPLYKMEMSKYQFKLEPILLD
ncbi:DUF2971 domain-containing protein [Tepidibacter hydrothermalis]|uniref:DUF2971 domain-containing protein n=1 Tax=Tepidibacter hydrothermalis TaxID=3036126 RepID=A0ABY8EH03_9FIRM|nr:DUF2971 domain-containing protein [Tepidibacter hydrothermalis]WFD10782.1 DUF2971 domain-containing protein [Tepidibacter hydrothermalis]